MKKQLESIDELRFIFTSPTFVTEKTPKAQREFYIPRISRERSLYGTEFEVKLRNELTQKAVAKECADWIRRKAIFKSNVTQEQMMGFMTVDESTYMPINGFTTVDLGCERGNNAYYPVQKTESYENANYFLKLFEQLWNDKNISGIIKERLCEVESCIKNGTPLASIFMIGSILEGILLGTASAFPRQFNQAQCAPKDKDTGKVRIFPEWTLNNMIDVAAEIGILKQDVKKFSHVVRDFRNYIHPYQQMSSQFSPDKHTAMICFQVLKAAIYQIGDYRKVT